jgi:hypothetical protein
MPLTASEVVKMAPLEPGEGHFPLDTLNACGNVFPFSSVFV